MELFVDGILHHCRGYDVQHRAGEGQQNLLNIFIFIKAICKNIIAHKERIPDILVSFLVAERYKVADQEDDGSEGSSTVDELKQISTQTQSLSVAAIRDGYH